MVGANVGRGGNPARKNQYAHPFSIQLAKLCALELISPVDGPDGCMKVEVLNYPPNYELCNPYINDKVYATLLS